MKNFVIFCSLTLFLMACGTPSAQTSPTPAAGATSTPQVTPVYEDEVIEEGKGDPVDPKGAVELQIMVWEDKFEGKPFGQGELNTVLAMESPEIPGLAKLAEGVKEGGVRRAKLNAQMLFTKLPPGAPFTADKIFYVEMKAVKIFPPDELVTKTVKEGEGRAIKPADLVEVHYTGWLEKFEGKKFDSSRERAPFVFQVGQGHVIPGWDKGILGMKPGEVRRLEIPHFLAYGAREQNLIPPYSKLYFEIEFLGFIEEGELKVETVKEGQGEGAKSGDSVVVHYTGWTGGFESKSKFDSSLDRGQPFEVTLGQRRVIQGWEQGLLGMKVGEKRRLTIPFNLGYGAKGSPPKIPPYATLYFEVERMPAGDPKAPATPKP